MTQGAFSFGGPPARDTLKEARDLVRRERHEPEGTICPCCDKRVKVYRRKFHKEMAKAIRALARDPDRDFRHLFRFLVVRNISHSDGPALQLWGLIESSGEERDDGNPRAGFYRITKKGLDLAAGRIEIPRSVLTYNDAILEFGEEKIGIREALGDAFDYDEMMSAPAALSKG